MTLLVPKRAWRTLPVTLDRSAASQEKTLRVARGRSERGEKREHRAGWTGYTFDLEWGSAGAEDAVAELIERPWDDDPALDYDGDVGPGVQVRWTTHEPGHLPIHPGPPHDRWGREDFDDHVFFHVTGNPARYTIHGWIEGLEAKFPEFWWGNLDNPCFMFPARALHTHDPELPEWP